IRRFFFKDCPSSFASPDATWTHLMATSRSIPPSPSELRAAIAVKQVPKFLVALHAGLHPTRLGAYLSERLPIPPAVAVRVAEAIERTPSPLRERRALR